MKRLIISLILLIFFMGGKDVFAQATVEGKLILPEPAPGIQYWVIVDQDGDGGNGYVRYCLGICGSDTEISYAISNVPAGTYYIYGGVRIVSSHNNPPEAGDYMGVYGGTIVEYPNEPNAVVPAFGTVTFDIILSKWTGDVDVTPPAIPTNFTATAGDGNVLLSWNANSETDLHSYHLFKGTVDGGTVTYFFSVGKNTTSYTDNNVTNGTTYYYKINAGDTSNNQSVISAQVSATPTAPIDVTRPATPTITSASAMQCGVKLEWTQNTEPDLANYYIYRSKTSGFTPSLSKPMVTSNKIATVDKSLTQYNDITNVESNTVYYYKMSAVDNSGNESGYSSQATATTLNILNDNSTTEFALYQNVPNPFNPITEIEFSIPTDTDVNIVIYDLMGNEIKTLINDFKPVGQYKVNWDSRDNTGQPVSGGIYFYKLQAGDFIQTNKMLLLK